MTESRTDVNTAIAAMPPPSKAELAKRSSIVLQLIRFIVLNLRILKLSRQHH